MPEMTTTLTTTQMLAEALQELLDPYAGVRTREFRHEPEGARAPKQTISERELQVIRAVLKGLTNREIAAELHLSEDTISHHLFNIFNKLGVSCRVELAMYAIAKNLTGE